MQDQELVQLRFNLIGHHGVEITAAIIEQTTNISETYRVYTQERRDRHDPYAFLEFCQSRYAATILLTRDKQFNKKYKKAAVFNFSQQVM